jgi:hypothetical protein
MAKLGSWLPISVWMARSATFSKSRSTARWEIVALSTRVCAASGWTAISLDKAGISLEEVDLLIPHQANVRIIDATARRLGLDEANVYVNIHSYGNTSAATIPVALTEALEEGRISSGDVIVFAAFGGGLTWGSAVFRWGDRTEPIGESDAELPPTDRDTMDLLRPNFDFFGLPEKLS